MEIIGVRQDREPVFTTTLRHGEPPATASLRHGFRLVRPLSAARQGEEIELSVLVEPAGKQRMPAAQSPHRDRGLRMHPGEKPRVFQRVAAYAVVISERGLLVTEYSDQTAATGRYGLPGGGIDPGEEPHDAVLREVVEETSQIVQVGDLVDTHSAHWIGRSPRGDIEDFHAVRLVFTATCADPTEPEVLDIGGTTHSARWVELSAWTSVPWTSGWRDLIAPLLP